MTDVGDAMAWARDIAQSDAQNREFRLQTQINDLRKEVAELRAEMQKLRTDLRPIG